MRKLTFARCMWELGEMEGTAHNTTSTATPDLNHADRQQSREPDRPRQEYSKAFNRRGSQERSRPGISTGFDQRVCHDQNFCAGRMGALEDYLKASRGFSSRPWPTNGGRPRQVEGGRAWHERPSYREHHAWRRVPCP